MSAPDAPRAATGVYASCSHRSCAEWLPHEARGGVAPPRHPITDVAAPDRARASNAGPVGELRKPAIAAVTLGGVATGML